jgi:hypothetical protein
MPILGVVASQYTVSTATPPAHSNTVSSQGSVCAGADTGTGGILVFHLVVYAPTTLSSGSVTSPAGAWTLRSYAAAGVSGNGISSWVWTKAAGSDSAPLDITTSAGGVYHGSSCTRITHAGGTPLFNAAATPNTNTTTSCNIPAVTTTADGCLLLAYTGGENGSWSGTPSGFTAVATWVSNGLKLWRRNAGLPGVYGPTATTLSGADDSVCHCIAISPP